MLRNANSSVLVVRRCLQGSITPTLSRHIATPTGTASSSYPPHSPEVAYDSVDKRIREKRKNLRPKPPGKVLPDGKRLLQPYELSRRLKAKCKEEQYTEAIEMLKTSPADAQNVVVWNTLISVLLDARKYKLSYQLYIEMKRRGFQPNVRTYSTILAGLSTIQDWKTHTLQLENAHKLYDDLMELVERLTKIDPNHPELSLLPLNTYLLILGRADCHQKLFDAYYAMKNEGPMAPDHFTYSILLNALRQRGEIENDPDPNIHRKNASDARLVWKQLVRATQKPGSFPVDSFHLAPIIQVLYRGSPSDQLMAFDIIREYLGLSKPGEPEVEGKVTLDARLFFIALDACVRTQKHRLALHWMQQMMDKPVKAKEKPIIEHRHMEQMLLAYGSLASVGSMNESQQALNAVEWAIRQSISYNHPDLRPSQKMYHLALAACWRCTDWDAAMRLFELMTGYESKDFTDGHSHSPIQNKRSEGYNLIPNSPTLCTLARTAVATKDQANMRQCLRILTRYGAEHLFVRAPGRAEHVDFYHLRAAEAIIRLVDGTLKKGEKVDVVRAQEASRWLNLKGKALEIIRAQMAARKQQPGGAKKPLPPLEESPLGTLQLLNETDEEISLDYDRRTSAPAKR